MMYRLYAIMGILFMLLKADAQPHALLVRFEGIQLEEGIRLTWTFKGGSQCEGTRIFRSAEGKLFAQIGEIPGVCGAPDAEISYTFVDNSPILNSQNHYRLELGNEGYTETISLEYIVLNREGYLVVPNPLTSNGILYFNNPQRKSWQLILSDISGKMRYLSSGNADRTELSNNMANSGLYLFRLIFDDKTALQGKLMIIR